MDVHLRLHSLAELHCKLVDLCYQVRPLVLAIVLGCRCSSEQSSQCFCKQLLLLDRERTEARGEATLAIAKQRDGECGFVTMWYEGAYCRFEPALLQDS